MKKATGVLIIEDRFIYSITNELYAHPWLQFSRKIAALITPETKFDKI